MKEKKAEKGTAWISVGAQPENFPVVALHEFGHSFGDLRDEYYEQNAGAGERGGTPNCLSKNEALDKWKQWPEVVAEAEQEKWKSCGGICDSSCTSLLRPSENSIMKEEVEWMDRHSEPGWKAFNPPSEAQIIEKLSAYS
ncbi:MAG: M64 family metallopeptidase [Nanoarchaeota archaeon]